MTHQHQHQFDPIHADVDEEIITLRSQVRRLRSGPRQKTTCLNTVTREIVCGLYVPHLWYPPNSWNREGGYKGFYARSTIPLTPKIVNDIHKRGDTNLGTSRGSHDTSKIADSIQNRGINQCCHFAQITMQFTSIL
ncbi:hypothetical protein ABKV19_009771 [Rosa sericea]